MSEKGNDASNKGPAGLDVVVADNVEDYESHNGPKDGSLHRQLKNRHIAMIRYFPSLSLLCMRGVAETEV
jgi:amino acid permease